MINYSFIIPHHNDSYLLNKLLETIPQREDIEIIVVDDNSDDDKKPHISRPDIQIRFISAQDSKGAGYARNVGIQLAKGKWLLFADSDDYYDKNLLQCLDKYKQSNVDIIYFGAYTNYRDLKSFDKNNGIDSCIQTFNSSKKGLKDIQRIGLSTNVPWNKMYNHEFVKRIRAKFEEIPISNDAWFVNYCGYMSRNIIAIPDKLYYYVLNDKGITRRKRPMCDHYLSLKSYIRRNHLKAECGLWDLMRLSIARRNLIISQNGFLQYVLFYLYWLTHDRTFYQLLFRKMFLKTKNYGCWIYNRCL